MNGRPLTRLRSRAGRWLLVILALRHDRETERSWLAETLWPDSREEQALYNLRRNLTDLRDALGEEARRFLTPSPRTLRLDLTGAFCDVIAFDAAVARGTIDSLREAVALYRGALLEGCQEEWAVVERGSREQSYIAALERLADGCSPSEAAHLLRQAIAIEPTRESAQRKLMETMAAVGDFAAVTQAYRDLRLFLHHELQTDPSPETIALYRGLIASKQAQVRTAASSDFSADAPSESARRLPRPLTELIGREQELVDVVACLRTSRLITLTGFGGIGKTRLAIAAAEAAAEGFKDGVCFVDLAALKDPALVDSAISSALDTPKGKDRPAPNHLVDYLQNKRALLLLDNCEHLLESCANTAAALLGHCPNLHLLATSRQPLGLTGEVVRPVVALPYPEPETTRRQGAAPDKNRLSELLEYPAVRLFVERARQARPDFAITPDRAETIADICRRLDGIPLAIELAAARTRSLSIEAINARLEDRFALLTQGDRAARPGHQTLAALLDWSYDLLGEKERSLLQRLSIFRGGWTLEAAEVVCADENTDEGSLSTAEILNLLTGLVERSLVQYEERADEGRYRLLDTVREYAAHRLNAGKDRHALALHHARYYAAVVEQVAPYLDDTAATSRLEDLEREHDNLRAAFETLERAATSAESEAEAASAYESAMRMAIQLYPFWWMRGHVSEGRTILAKLLELPAAQSDTQGRADALVTVGNLAHHQGDNTEAESFFERARSLYRALDDRRGEAAALSYLGEVAGSRSDFSTARARLEEALTIHRQLGERQKEAENLGHLGYITRELGDYDSARALTEQALAIQRGLGNRLGEAWNLGSLGHVACGQNDYAQAIDLFEQASAIYREADLPTSAAWILNSLAHALRKLGNQAAARPLLEQAITINRNLNNRAGVAWSLMMYGDVLLQLGDPDGAESALVEANALRAGDGSQVGEAWTLCYLGDVERVRGDFGRARTHYRQAAGLFEGVGIRPGPLELLIREFRLLAEETRWIEAACLWGEIGARREKLPASSSVDLTEYDLGYVERVRAALGEDHFQNVVREGYVTAHEQAQATVLASNEAAIDTPA